MFTASASYLTVLLSGYIMGMASTICMKVLCGKYKWVHKVKFVWGGGDWC